MIWYADGAEFVMQIRYDSTMRMLVSQDLSSSRGRKWAYTVFPVREQMQGFLSQTFSMGAMGIPSTESETVSKVLVRILLRYSGYNFNTTIPLSKFRHLIDH